MKKFLGILIFVLTTVTSWSRSSEIDGIYYNLDKNANTASVTNGRSKYSGSVIIPEEISKDGISYTVTSIGENAFNGCSELTSVSIPNSVESIGYKAFYECKSLSSINIPNSVTSIGESAFWFCYSLPEVDQIRYADTYLVQAVDRDLTTANIKEGTRWIGSDAFSTMRNLSSVNIPESVTSIEKGAFSYSAMLTTVSIPNSVISIGEEAFFQCSSLESVDIPNSVTNIGKGAFNRCINLISVTIPSSVTSLEAQVFYNCNGLTTVSIPNSVTSIGAEAFAYCSKLASVTIPNSVTSIGDGAFSWDMSMRDVTVEWENPLELSSEGVFIYVNNIACLHVPVGTAEKYAAAEVWKEFSKIEEYEVSGISPIGIESTKIGTRKYIDNGRVVIEQNGKKFCIGGQKGE